MVVEEPKNLKPSLQQRVRWARGHLRVVALEWWPMTRRGLRGDFRSLDIALYLLYAHADVDAACRDGSLALAAVSAPFSLPLAPLAVAFGGEWGVPGAVAFRDRLLPRTRAGVELALRHALLNLLWFPIGVWALFTPRSRVWVETPRSTEDQPDAIVAA